MAIGNHITLVRSVPNIPWYNALGILQNLNPAILQSMASTPANQWAERGLLIPFKVKQIAKHNVGARPLATVGFTNWSAQGITVDTSNNINRQGTVVNGAQYQTAQANVVGTVQALGCFYQSVFWTVNIFEDDVTHELYVSMSRDYANPWTDLTIRQLRVDTGAETNLTFNNANMEPNGRTRTVGGSSVGTTFQLVDIFYGGILFSACSFDFELSAKLFKNYNSLKEYQTTGNTEGQIGKEPEPETPAEDRKTELFYKSTIYKRVDGVQKDVKVGESNITFVVQYKSNDGTENYPAIGQVAGYVNDFSPVNSSTWGNIKWKKSSNAKIVQIKVDYTGEDGVRHSQTYQPLNFPYNTKNYGFYESYQNGTIRYYSKYATNMRIYANESDIDSYLGGDPTVKPLYDGNTGKINPTDYIGDPVVYNAIDYTVDADMSSCWILTKDQVDDLAEVFATGLTKEEGDDNTLINITKTCARSFMAQSEPIDAVVDLFWLPIDVTGFCTSEDDNMTFSYDRYGILNGAKTIIDGTGEAMTVAESNTLRIGDGIGKLFNPINNLSTNIGATIGSAGSTSEVINTYSGTTPPPSNE